MNDAQTEYRKLWKAEEAIAHIHGWDFSHIADRHSQQELPWSYRDVILQYLTPEMRLLDIDTGGGEFLLSLNHPHANTAATENYPPNVALCRETLPPLGIDFRPADGKGILPFPDACFHMVIDRHGDFNPEEIHRVLKPGGFFITQQVGAQNDRDLVTLLCGETPLPFPDQYLNITAQKFRDAGFQVLREEESFQRLYFYDTGALVWFARILTWEFPGFSVDTHFPQLLEAQRILEETGSIDGTIHRFLLVAGKAPPEVSK
ncbi:MAG: methyltransferase domain-containing protein [Oscillospiraceae bacterium]|nr:methyltransferase domain-containing protein [Oscillospiraceae bacterium]